MELSPDTSRQIAQYVIDHLTKALAQHSWTEDALVARKVVPEEAGDEPIKIHVLDDAITLPGVTPESLLPVVHALALTGHLLVVGLDDETLTRLTYYRVKGWLSCGTRSQRRDSEAV